MHKFISVILTLVVILSVSACGGGTAPQSGENKTEEITISLTGEINGEITVSSYETMKSKVFLEEAARLFEEKYPGTKVYIETFTAMPEIKKSEDMIMVNMQDNPQDRQDYINKVNTALMSGGGADILAMDVLPFHKYADAGQLENLEDYIEADPEFNKADYRENVLDASAYKGGTWFLPMDYTFNYYAYDSALLTGSEASGFGKDGKFTAEELITIAEPSFDGGAQLFNRPDYAKGPRPDMWSLLLDENYTAFVDMESRKANFNDGKFEALLETVKQYGEQGYIPQGQTGKTDAEAMMRKEREGSDNQYYYKSQNAVNLASLFTRDLGISMTGLAEGGTMAVGDNDEIAGIAASVSGAVPFSCEQAYGINANSGNKETAWAFIRFLLSGEMQLNSNLSPVALPVLNSARDEKMKLMLTSVMAQQGQQLKDSHLEAIGRYNETVEKLSGQIDAYDYRDTVINDMIAEEVHYFFEGSKTAAEVSDVLQNKVGLYLNE